MRSITCISLMLWANLASAEVPLGCFERHYSPEHIAAHPAQIVDWIRLHVEQPPQSQFNEIYAYIQAQFIDQGRIKGTKGAGKILDQGLVCRDFSRGPGCAVDCDGGAFQFVKIGPDSITIETANLSVGPSEGCSGPESLAEVLGAPVRYRLDRVDDAVCEEK